MRFKLVFALLMLVSTATQAETRPLRFPDLYENNVVFSYASDIWIAETTGGTARRLTSHPGQELFTAVILTGKGDVLTIR